MSVQTKNAFVIEASANEAGNSTEVGTHRSCRIIVGYDEAGVKHRYLWSAVSYGEAGANETSLAEANQAAGDVEVQCQASANVDNGTLDNICNNKVHQLKDQTLDTKVICKACGNLEANTCNKVNLSTKDFNKMGAIPKSAQSKRKVKGAN